MGCLQCGRTPGREYSDDFCSAECEAAHREKILGRLSELSNAEEESSDSWRTGLLSLAQTTADLRYSTADMSAAGPGRTQADWPADHSAAGTGRQRCLDDGAACRRSDRPQPGREGAADRL